MMLPSRPIKQTYHPSKRYARLSPGAAVRIMRELAGLTQAELAIRAHVPRPSISAIERGYQMLGIEQARKLARVLGVHPAVLAFPNWRQ